MYVGRKYFKAKIAGKVRESNWQRYFGSCVPLTADIHHRGTHAFSRRILSVHTSRRDTNYAEVREMFERDVLNALAPDGSRLYYNGNIMARWFVPRHPA